MNGVNINCMGMVGFGSERGLRSSYGDYVPYFNKSNQMPYCGVNITCI